MMISRNFTICRLSREESRPKVGASSNEKAAVLTNSNFSRKDFRMMLFALNITYPNTQEVKPEDPDSARNCNFSQINDITYSVVWWFPHNRLPV